MTTPEQREQARIRKRLFNRRRRAKEKLAMMAEDAVLLSLKFCEPLTLSFSVSHPNKAASLRD